MDLQAVLPVSSISTWRLVKTWARAGPYQSWRWRLGPARFGSYDDASIATAQAACHAPASEAVTAVTDYFSSSPLFFGRRVIDVQSPKRRPPTTALSKKLHSLPSSIRRIIQPRGWRVRSDECRVGKQKIA